MRRLFIYICLLSLATAVMGAEHKRTEVYSVGQWFIPVEALHLTNGTGFSTGVAYQPREYSGLIVFKVMAQDTDSIPGAPPDVIKTWSRTIVVPHPEIRQPTRWGVSIGVMIPVGRR